MFKNVKGYRGKNNGIWRSQGRAGEQLRVHIRCVSFSLRVKTESTGARDPHRRAVRRFVLHGQRHERSAPDSPQTRL